jgi:hypothetical protein
MLMDGWMAKERRGDTTRDRMDKPCMYKLVSFLPEGICFHPSLLQNLGPHLCQRGLTKPASQASCLFALRPGCSKPTPGSPVRRPRKRWHRAPVSQAGYEDAPSSVPNPNQPRSQMISQTPSRPAQSHPTSPVMRLYPPIITSHARKDAPS